MDSSDRDKCINITKKMQSMPLCKIFLHPIDPIENRCLDYREIIKHPMDLETVMHRLEINYYQKISDWVSDVELIWHNALVYNVEESFYYLIALDMQMWFRKEISKISKSSGEEWILNLRKITDQLKSILNMPPSLSNIS